MVGDAAEEIEGSTRTPSRTRGREHPKRDENYTRGMNCTTYKGTFTHFASQLLKRGKNRTVEPCQQTVEILEKVTETPEKG